MSASLLPPGVAPAAAVLLWARGIRSFGDGFVAVLLPVHLLRLGFDAFEVGVLSTTTLLGSALLTLGVGLFGHRFDRKRLFFAASCLMAGTGAGFAMLDGLWPLLIVALVGTLNPTSGDVSVFLPLEHSTLSETASDSERTAVFARYSLTGALSAAVGSLAAAVPEIAGAWWGISMDGAIRGMFGVYAAIGLVSLVLYRRLPAPGPAAAHLPAEPLGRSRPIVYRLAAFFSLDAFAGGFVVQSLLALWLFERFGLSLTAAGAFFFWSGVFTAFSYMGAVWIARRIGLINTMVFSHIPANLFLILAAVAPNLETALALLLVRSALSQMDVPTRTSYVMAVVTPPERPAAASITAVPRSLASALSPALGGLMLSATPFGWPLIACGTLKIVYDILLLVSFRHHKPPEERAESSSKS